MMKSAKRMILTVGDSRVGKSTVTKLLIEFFQRQDKNFKVYDHDNRNKLKAYQDLVFIGKIDFFDKRTDQILNDFTNDELDIIMVDMPGQYIDKICKYIVQSNLVDLLVEYQWKLTFLQPISHREDCIDYLKQVIDTTTNNANYVVVKNQHFDTRFIEYEQSIQSKLSIIGGAEVELTALHRDHYQVIDKACKPYSQCCKDISIYVIYRSYIYRWIENFRNSVVSNRSASEYLGLL